MLASKIELIVRDADGKEIPSINLSYIILEAQQKIRDMGYTSSALFSHVVIAEGQE